MKFCDFVARLCHKIIKIFSFSPFPAGRGPGGWGFRWVSFRQNKMRLLGFQILLAATYNLLYH
jgi:hypothetical protein